MPNLGFKLMTFTYYFHDLIKPVGDILEEFGIKEGAVVVDYGCGPGRYIKKASEIVGEKGKVYAADIQLLAIESVKKKIKKYKLTNVIPILVEGYNSSIRDDSIDIIYALDMFHRISDAQLFFKELNRIIKQCGKLYIEDGHQSRERSLKKIKGSNLWEIEAKKETYLKCKAVKY